MKLSIQELIIILVIVVIIFGPTQLPKLAKMFGKSVNSFKKSIGSGEEEPAQKHEEEL